MDSLLWTGIGLIMLGMLLIFVEAFIPSGGVIGLAAAAVAIVGVVLLFRYDTTWGVIGLLSTLVLAPISFMWAIKILPNTPFGQKMFGDSDEEIAARREEQASHWREERNALIHQEGVAATDLHPSGIVTINNNRHDAIAKGPIIEKGAKVRVVSVQGLQIEVRGVDS